MHPTADLFTEPSTRSARGVPVELWLVARRKLKMLDVAQQLGDLRSPPGNRLEALKGRATGPAQYSWQRSVPPDVQVGR